MNEIGSLFILVCRFHVLRSNYFSTWPPENIEEWMVHETRPCRGVQPQNSDVHDGDDDDDDDGGDDDAAHDDDGEPSCAT